MPGQEEVTRELGDPYLDPLQEDFEQVLHAVQHPNHTACSGGGSTQEKSTPKRKEGEKFDFETWLQVSRFSSWKVSFRSEVMSDMKEKERERRALLSCCWLARCACCGTTGFLSFLCATVSCSWF